MALQRHDQGPDLTDCGDPLCRICWPDENFTNYKDYDDEKSQEQEDREAFIR